VCVCVSARARARASFVFADLVENQGVWFEAEKGTLQCDPAHLLYKKPNLRVVSWEGKGAAGGGEEDAVWEG
jgi:hypothetical protein